MLPLSDSALSNDDRHALLVRARQAIVEIVLHRRIADFPPAAGRLAAPGSAFVTVHCFSKLRGCIGRTDPSLPLAETVVQCAISAALHDPRFAPLDPADIPGLEIEISVLSEMAPISPLAIEPGKHGLVVIQGTRRGLLLPQVAVEHHWSADRFLAETCKKAGLDGDACLDPETKILAFTADVFSETELPPA
jgi:AmmeMemoRadiSam system protein A